jgi:hypothetical protein
MLCGPGAVELLEHWYPAARIPTIVDNAFCELVTCSMALLSLRAQDALFSWKAASLSLAAARPLHA